MLEGLINSKHENLFRSLTMLLMPYFIEKMDFFCWNENVIIQSGLVAQWITRLPTEQKIPGSSPGKIYFLYFCSIIKASTLTCFLCANLY